MTRSSILLSLLMACAGMAPLAAADTPALDTDRQVTYHVFMGELAAERGDAQAAAREYLSAARLSRDSSLASHAAVLAYGAGDDAGALEAARRWQVLAPKDAD